MVALFSMIISFLVSFAPKVLELWGRKLDYKHELDIMEKQIQYQRELKDQLEEIRVTNDLINLISSKQVNERPSGIRWIDGLNATVRPVVAYTAFSLYCIIKIFIFIIILRENNLSSDIVNIIWTSFDEAVIGSIVGFFFGGRIATKFFQR